MNTSRTIRLVGAEFNHADGQIDVTKLIFALRNFANAAKNDFKVMNTCIHTDVFHIDSSKKKNPSSGKVMQITPTCSKFHFLLLRYSDNSVRKLISNRSLSRCVLARRAAAGVQRRGNVWRQR